MGAVQTTAHVPTAVHQPTFVTMAAPQTVYATAPATVTSPMLTVREGVVFNQEHPRNQFAKKPHVTQSGPVVQAIDWSSTGMPTQVQSAIIQGGGGNAHLSPVAYTQAAQPVPLRVMRAQTQAVPNYSPKIVQNYASVNSKAYRCGYIQQPRK